MFTRKTTKKPLHVVRLGEERLEEKQLIEALQGLGDKHPAWEAVLQVVTDLLGEARAQVGSIELAEMPGKLAHTAGGCEWLEYLLLRLKGLKERQE